MSATRAPDAEAVRQAIGADLVWYHTLELAPGTVTAGHIDLRPVAPRVLPADLGGKRALDVGTFDGFWAFELERRGAEVTAIDVDRVDSAEWPPLSRARLERDAQAWGLQLGRGFALAAAAIGSRVRRVECNVYELSPEVIGGPVEFAFAGAILLHLRDPVRALERILAALHPGGTLTILEPFSIRDTLGSPRRPSATFRANWSDFTWWLPNLAALRAWLEAAGFERIGRRGFYRPSAVPEMRQWLAGFTAHRPVA